MKRPEGLATPTLELRPQLPVVRHGTPGPSLWSDMQEHAKVLTPKGKNEGESGASLTEP